MTPANNGGLVLWGKQVVAHVDLHVVGSQYIYSQGQCQAEVLHQAPCMHDFHLTIL